MVVGTLYEYKVKKLRNRETWIIFGELIISGYCFQCEQLCDEIYAVPWHRLPVKLQKIFVIVLQNAQSPNLMTIGDLAPLNLASELKVRRFKEFTCTVVSGGDNWMCQNFPFEDFEDDLFVLHNSGVEHGLNHVDGSSAPHSIEVNGGIHSAMHNLNVEHQMGARISLCKHRFFVLGCN